MSTHNIGLLEEMMKIIIKYLNWFSHSLGTEKSCHFVGIVSNSEVSLILDSNK